MRVGRTPTDIALLNAAALVQVTGGVYQRVRLALGGVNMESVRLQAIERQLEGRARKAEIGNIDKGERDVVPRHGVDKGSSLASGGGLDRQIGSIADLQIFHARHLRF